MRKTKSALKKEYLEVLSALSKRVKVLNREEFIRSIRIRDERNYAIAFMTRYDRWDLRDALIEAHAPPPPCPILGSLERRIRDLEEQTKE